MFFLERGDLDDGSLDSIVQLSSRPDSASKSKFKRKIVNVNDNNGKGISKCKDTKTLSKEDLDCQTCGIFLFWLFVEFCVVHTLGGCIRMITDDGPLSPNLAITPPTRVTKWRTLPTVSSAALVDQLSRCSPRSDR